MLNFYFLFDLTMSAIMFLSGILFYRSEGKAADLLSGYSLRSAEDREKFDEKEMCRIYGKKMMQMAIPFLAGAAMDTRFPGIGCLTAWGIWLILFLLLLMERHRRERL